MRKEKMNNKGFSLVELIIVIAIMAVLIVVLAPQYLKYVEKSRNSTDVSNATEMVTAMQVYAADPDVAAADAFKEGVFTLTVNATGTTIGHSGTNDNTEAVKKAFLASGLSATADAPKTTCVSKTNWTDYVIKATVSSAGSITFEYSSTSGDTAFKNMMAGKAVTTTPETP